MRLFSSALLLALGPALVAQSPLSAGELMKPREPGDLAVLVAASDSPTYIREWLSKRYEESPRLFRVEETVRGRWLYVSFLVTGLTPNAELAYDFTAGFRLLRPDGSVLFDEPEYATNKSKNAARRGFLMVDPALDLRFDATDPLGKYTLEVTARDNIAKIEAKTTYDIHLLPDN